MTTWATEHLVTESNIELLLIKTGPFRIVQVMSKTAVIEVLKKMAYIILCQCTGLHQSQRRRRRQPKENRMQTHDNHAEREESQAGDTELKEEDVGNSLPENAEDRTVRHVWKEDNVKYVVRCYCYSPADDTVELPAHIPKHFMTHYWCPARKQHARRQKQRKRSRGRQGTDATYCTCEPVNDDIPTIC